MTDEATNPAQTSPTPMPAATRKGRPPGAASGPPKARIGRPATGRGDRIVLGAEVVAQLDALGGTLAARFGFRPTPGQTVAWLVASVDTSMAAASAGVAVERAPGLAP